MRVLQAFVDDPTTCDRLERAVALITGAIRGGGKVLACGNGGSMTQAAHLCEELTGRFRDDREPFAAIACTDSGHLSCTANDYGYDEVFTRWVRALGRTGDALVVFSTSGNSENVVRAVEAAKRAGVSTIALLGKGGGRLADVCDVELICPGETSDRIQEVHMVVLHCLIEGVERELLGR